jgi:hypothetical protein
MHVDQVMSRVPRENRCPGHATTERRGLLRRLLGRA